MSLSVLPCMPCFPVALEVVVGIANKVSSGCPLEEARTQPWGFGRDEGSVSTKASTSADYFHSSQRNLPLNYKEIVKRIAEMQRCLSSCVSLCSCKVKQLEGFMVFSVTGY